MRLAIKATKQRLWCFSEVYSSGEILSAIVQQYHLHSSSLEKSWENKIEFFGGDSYFKY